MQSRNGPASIAYKMSSTDLAAELRKARGDRSLSDISRLCGLPVSTLSRLEKREIEIPTKQTLEVLSGVYGLPLEYLAQLVYLGKRPAEPEAQDDTPASNIASSPAENERPWRASRPKKHLAAIS